MLFSRASVVSQLWVQSENICKNLDGKLTQLITNACGDENLTWGIETKP